MFSYISLWNVMASVWRNQFQVDSILYPYVLTRDDGCVYDDEVYDDELVILVCGATEIEK